MTTILDDIVAAKREEVEHQKACVRPEALEARIATRPRPLNLSGALLGDRVRLIAEVKKASPSRGLLCPDFDPVRLARTYVENGAAAVSVLTDPRFQGTLAHLEAVKAELTSSGTPVLRKDFIFDPYQVIESRASGADAILLIVAILSPAQLADLLSLSRRLWMQCLVEVHTLQELETALGAGAEIIGVNNRDLRTFRTSLSVTEELAGRVPRGKVVVSESGINGREHVRTLRRLGVHAALVGEALVTAQDVAGKVRELAGP
jgi:indole-3-glycerol phosphate synthase